VVDAPFLGGAEMYISRLVSALDARRFGASLLMKAGGRDPHLDAWAAGLRADGIPVFEIPMRLPFVPADAAAMWRHFESHAPHIVHVNVPGPYDGQMGLILPIARASGARTVVTEHLPMVTPLWKRAAVKRLAYRSLDLAVTMTQANAKFLCEWQGAPASRVRVVPNGIARSFGANAVRGRSRRWEWGLRDRDVVVGYVGNIVPHKGLRRLIEAVSRSVQRDRFYLVVVGSGPDEAACRQLALDRGLSTRINFLGWRSHDETEEILGACDVLALPSSIEGLPYVILEAMASRLPVLAGRVYGIPEVVEDGVTGILVDPGSVDEITAGLDRLAGDSALRAAMGGAGRARFERHFTLERQVRRMEQLYESLLRGVANREVSV
jgi:glycosyltransferase involved in cell wall biosynthesis